MSTEKIVLRTCDGETFEVELSVVTEAETIQHMVEDDCVDGVIPLPNITASVFTKVLEYCKKHAGIGAGDETDELKKWDAEFIDVDTDTLYDLIMASNFLNIKKLLELCCNRVATLIKGKSPHEIRKTFNIKNDFTPDEEAAIRAEYGWALDD